MGTLVLNGATSGATTLQPTDATTQTITLPANSGTVITTASSGKVIPTAALPAGTVLQVVTGTVTGDISTTSASFVSSGCYATITPTSATSKIYIIVASNITYNSTSNETMQYQVYRGTSGEGSGIAVGASAWRTAPVGPWYQPSGYAFSDSPASTSALTYTVMHRANTAGYACGFCYGLGGGNLGTITLMEIAA